MRKYLSSVSFGGIPSVREGSNPLRVKRCQIGRLLVLAWTAALGVAAFGVTIDFEAVVGDVKPVNGVGQPPIMWYEDTSLFHYLKEAGVPYSRLHDVGGPYGRNIFVDIPNLFRNFDADEDDPANYDFTFTDNLLAKLVENGVEPYFRLGVTIENAARRKAYRVFPPKDYAKWARIAEHVIRHYTEGWADGFRHKITHWEIWNEPDSTEKIETNCMWRAPFPTFIEFYDVVSRHLKSKFPHLKIGGYGSSGFWLIAGAPPEKITPGRRNYVTCFTNFLAAAEVRRFPLDFFSFHSYASPAATVKQMAWCRKTLDAYGLKDTEMSLNEWLPDPEHKDLGTAKQAASIAAELVALQHGPVVDAEIYDARCGVGAYSPLFNCLTFKPHKAYYVYLAFNELRKLGRSVKVSGSADQTGAETGVWVTAAVGADGTGAALFANTGAPQPIDLGAFGRRVLDCRIIDETRQYEPIEPPTVIGSNAVLLVRYARR